MSLVCEGAVRNIGKKRREVHALHKIGPFKATFSATMIHAAVILSSPVDGFSRNEWKSILYSLLYVWVLFSKYVLNQLMVMSPRAECRCFHLTSGVFIPFLTMWKLDWCISLSMMLTGRSLKTILDGNNIFCLVIFLCEVYGSPFLPLKKKKKNGTQACAQKRRTSCVKISTSFLIISTFYLII